MRLKIGRGITDDLPEGQNVESRSIILAFSGSIGSGKSTLSTGVAQGLGWPQTSFGSYIRAIAAQNDLDTTSREVLQQVGADLVANGWEQFCSAVLAQAGWQAGMSLVVDGLRHVEALETMRALTHSSNVLLVYVALSRSEHLSRLTLMGIDNPARQRRIDTHSTEIQVATRLPSMADLVVDGARSADELINEILAWTRRATAI